MSIDQVTGIESNMSPAATLNTIPPEILLEIFGWVCWDEIDLTMLSVSRSMRMVLLSHPTIRALGAFSIQRSKKGICIVSNTTTTQSHPTSSNMNQLSPVTNDTIDELASQPWFRKLNTPQLQAAVTRRLIRIHWTPYLQRDGRLQKPGRMNQLARQITAIWWEAYAQAEQGDLCILPDAVVEYPWTHLQIWPVDGRVIIRDQLSNTWEELDVPIVRLVGEGVGRGEVGSDGRGGTLCDDLKT